VAICSSETSAAFQRTTRPYIPEESTVHNQTCENITAYQVMVRSWVQIVVFLTVTRYSPEGICECIGGMRFIRFKYLVAEVVRLH
jgi:hypothetical protein